MNGWGVAPDLRVLQGVQNDLIDLVGSMAIVTRNGEAVNTWKMRVGAERTFTEPSDPQDASTRAQVEWGFTFKTTQEVQAVDVQVGDRVQFNDPPQYTILGEVLDGSSMQTAIRCWGTKPKFAVATIDVDFLRWNPATEKYDIAVDTQTVKLVWDHIAPVQTPIRYTPAAESLLQGGRLIKENVIADGPFDVQVGDRFSVDGQAAVITSILGNQELATEARFTVDLGGPQ